MEPTFPRRMAHWPIDSTRAGVHWRPLSEKDETPGDTMARAEHAVAALGQR